MLNVVPDENESPAASGTGRARVKILMVDDRPANLLTTQAVLDDLGEDLVTAASAHEAVQHLLREDFGLILLDVMMPEMDGFELARQIRRLRRSRHTPIIFLTAAGNEDSLIKGYEMGAVDYLLKPVAPEILRSKVAVFVQLARQAEKVKSYAEMLEERNGELRELMAGQREKEREILRLNEELESRIEALSELNAELQAFSFTVSHDLNGPVARITSFSRALRNDGDTVLSEQGLVYVNRIESASQHMGTLISDLLELARSDHGELKPEKVDLSAIAREIAGELQATATERKVQWEIAEGIEGFGDAGLLAVVLRNLLGNAWKFTRPIEAARIEFGAKTTADSSVYFVRDNGIGFEMSDRDKLFQPFQRLPAAREFQGTGIGLATVTRIMKRHGGRVWAESEKGAGATFYFEPALEKKSAMTEIEKLSKGEK